MIGSVHVGFESDGARTPSGVVIRFGGWRARRKRRVSRDGGAPGDTASVGSQVGSSGSAGSGTTRPGVVQTGWRSATGSSRAEPRRHADGLDQPTRRQVSTHLGGAANPIAATRAVSGARKRTGVLGPTPASVGDESGARRRRWRLRRSSGLASRRGAGRGVRRQPGGRFKGSLARGQRASALSGVLHPQPSGSPEGGRGHLSRWSEIGAATPRTCEIGVPSAGPPARTRPCGPPRGGDGAAPRRRVQSAARPGRWQRCGTARVLRWEASDLARAGAFRGERFARRRTCVAGRAWWCAPHRGERRSLVFGPGTGASVCRGFAPCRHARCHADEQKHQGGNGRGDAVRLSTGGILRRVRNRDAGIGSDDRQVRLDVARTVKRVEPHDRQQGATNLQSRSGASRRSGARPQGWNETCWVVPACRSRLSRRWEWTQRRQAGIIDHGRRRPPASAGDRRAKCRPVRLERWRGETERRRRRWEGL